MWLIVSLVKSYDCVKCYSLDILRYFCVSRIFAVSKQDGWETSNVCSFGHLKLIKIVFMSAEVHAKVQSSMVNLW